MSFTRYKLLSLEERATLNLNTPFTVLISPIETEAILDVYTRATMIIRHEALNDNIDAIKEVRTSKNRYVYVKIIEYKIFNSKVGRLL